MTATTREQDHAIEQLSLRAGGITLAIRDGYADGHIEITDPTGRSIQLNQDGLPTGRGTGLNFSIDWPEGTTR